MSSVVRRALRALTLLGACASPLLAQDSTLARAAAHALPLDTTRLQPFTRHYDIVVQTRDSTFGIGTRSVSVQRGQYAGAPAWVIVESRLGNAPAMESLFVTPALRPVHLAASQGGARIGAQFGRDSMYAVATSPVARQNIIMAAPADLLVSSTLVEVVLPLLPLGPDWSDSARVLSIEPTAAAIIPAVIAVLEQEELQVADARRPTWVVALRTEPRYVLFWIDRETGAVARVQHALRGGVILEYRLRAGPPPPEGSRPPP